MNPFKDLYRKLATNPLNDVPAFWKSPYFYFSLGIGYGGLLLLRRRIQGFWRDYQPIISVKDLSGKTAIITGGNSGIGLATAVHLANLNANVIITCRDEKRAESAVNHIKLTSGGNGNKIQSMGLDLSDLDSVQQFASLITADDSIDIDYLILNAGIMPNSDQQSKDGLNICFQVNYLSHFYLTNLLLDRVKRTAAKRWKLCANRYGAPVRIVAVSSGAHSTADIPMSDADFETLANTQCSYGQSKLLQIVHMKQLQKELHAYDQQIQCLSCTPGMTRTDIFAKYAAHSSIIIYPVFALLYPIYRFVSRSAGIGAQTVLHACTNDSTVNGAYYSNCTLKYSKGKNECSNDCVLWQYVWGKSNALIQSLSK